MPTNERSPTPPCESYAKCPNYYGPYTYCSLDARFKRDYCMVSYCKKGEYNAQISPKSELCGFKWTNTQNKRVHDLM